MPVCTLHAVCPPSCMLDHFFAADDTMVVQVGKCARLMSKSEANVASVGKSTYSWAFIAIYAAWLRRA